MIVLINKKNKVLIHKHVKKDEIYQILEGKIMIEIFMLLLWIILILKCHYTPKISTV